MIDILYTPSQTILVIICGFFQYLHNMKKQVKIEEKFKASMTPDSLHCIATISYKTLKKDTLAYEFLQGTHFTI